MPYYAHPTAVIEQGAAIGDDTTVWHFSHVMASAVIGNHCNLGQSVYVDVNAVVGNHCRIQNNVNVYEGVVLEDYVFCGPSMTFTNVKTPRCLYPKPRGGKGYYKTLVKYGASLGAHVTVVCGVTIGKHALVGSGAVVTHDLPDYALAVGNPARQIGWACECGERLNDALCCSNCQKIYRREDDHLIEVVK